MADIMYACSIGCKCWHPSVDVYVIVAEGGWIMRGYVDDEATHRNQPTCQQSLRWILNFQYINVGRPAVNPHSTACSLCSDFGLHLVPAVRSALVCVSLDLAEALCKMSL